MIRLLIADDHQVLLEGFELLFKHTDDIEVVATCANGREVLEKLQHLTADVMLLDIDMPVMNGLEACKEVCKKYPATKVIGLSTFKNPSYIKRMTQNGASGYLLKNASAEEITKAIRTVHGGESYFSSHLERELLQELFSRNSMPLPSVTRREKDVLELLAQGFNYRQISEKLFISLNTVNSHRKNLISKFQVKNTTELVKEAMEQGVI